VLSFKWGYAVRFGIDVRRSTLTGAITVIVSLLGRRRLRRGRRRAREPFHPPQHTALNPLDTLNQCKYFNDRLYHEVEGEGGGEGPAKRRAASATSAATPVVKPRRRVVSSLPRVLPGHGDECSPGSRRMWCNF